VQTHILVFIEMCTKTFRFSHLREDDYNILPLVAFVTEVLAEVKDKMEHARSHLDS